MKKGGCKNLLQIRCFLQHPQTSLKINPANQSITGELVSCFSAFSKTENFSTTRKVSTFLTTVTLLEHLDGNLKGFLAACCTRKSSFTAAADMEELRLTHSSFQAGLFFKLADKIPHLRGFMNITGFPFHFSAIFQFRTQIRLQCVEEQEARVAILSSSPMLMDTHFFANFSTSEWASRCRTSIEGLEQEIRPP